MYVCMYFYAKNEYIDGQFLAGKCVAAAAAVAVAVDKDRWADGADVVFTDTPLSIIGHNSRDSGISVLNTV